MTGYHGAIINFTTQMCKRFQCCFQASASKWIIFCGTRELWYFGEGYVVAGALSDHFLSEQSFLNVMEFEQMTVFCEIQHSELCSCSGHP